jgi:hypothetical protein
MPLARSSVLGPQPVGHSDIAAALFSAAWPVVPGWRAATSTVRPVRRTRPGGSGAPPGG